MDEISHDWIPFYTELADRLLDWRDRRGELIGIICEMFRAIDIKCPTLDSEYPPADIDPFTVFGLFNKGLTTENRIRIAGGLAERLGVRAAVPRNFAGIPVLDKRKGTFYRFSSNPKRRPEDIDNLWDLLAAALPFADEGGEARRQAFIEAFDRARTNSGVRWMITFGLFWARPGKFVCLDERTRWVLTDTDTVPLRNPEAIGSLRKVPSGEGYVRICDALAAVIAEGCTVKSLAELFALTYDVSEKENRRRKAEKARLIAEAGDDDDDEEDETDREVSFDWILFYSELADRLLDYRERRGELISIICEMYSALAARGVTYPKLDDVYPPSDIDPFTIFGLFNKGLTNEKRIITAGALAERLGVKTPVPQSFEGVPVLNNQKATFYLFTNDPERSAHGIDDLWSLFAAAIAYADAPAGENASERAAFIRAYDAVRGTKYIRWRHTMGLFWVRAYRYLNLDKKNRRFLLDPECMALNDPEVYGNLSEVPDGERYDRICEAILQELGTGRWGFSTIPELSREAWMVSGKEKAEAAAEEDSVTDGTRYWACAAGENASLWEQCHEQGIIAIGWGYDFLGDLMQYGTREEINTRLTEKLEAASYPNVSLALWEFSHEMKPGDVIYAKKGSNTILGRGVVISDYIFKVDGVLGRDTFRNVRKVTWTHCERWSASESIPMKTLTEVTNFPDYIAELEAHFGVIDDEKPAAAAVASTAAVTAPEPAPEPEPEYTPEPYSPADFLSEVYMDESDYATLVRLIRRKRNVILQGPPGVGKTFAAERLAWSMIGAKDQRRVGLVQFHQNYAYEDFLMGWRPTRDGFELRHGPFFEFCRRAEADPGRDYFFVIDEINRGNLSKIFGELLMLIESDKRGKRVKLLYGEGTFTVPANVYLIGMMNTADRSIAIIDYALRRRFAFFDMKPGFSSRGFTEYLAGLASDRMNRLVECVRKLNVEIRADETLGSGFEVGHSYFCGLSADDPGEIGEIVEYEIIPLVREYWYDDPDRASHWAEALRAAVR
ncbi:AAA family ATPase [Sutterella sp.]|uniref:AAA family ATPase n=1 Tax=Sutterella sp. TaxID=1981025 RepID=UPI0026DFABD6|nr:AAA family ATPase [Sutterella sp.]MDO5531819.1 AAA family ATPase [Sutterella sp.]